MITYSSGYDLLTTEEWEDLLNLINLQFCPPISSITNIDSFKEKLSLLAHSIFCFDQSQIIGFCSFYDNEPQSQNAFLTLLYVVSEYRKNGIANELIVKMISILKEKNFSTISLEVNVDNLSAIKLYEKFGFNPVGQIENKICMSRSI